MFATYLSLSKCDRVYSVVFSYPRRKKKRSLLLPPFLHRNFILLTLTMSCLPILRTTIALTPGSPLLADRNSVTISV